MPMPISIGTTAFSPCRQYRYTLWREWIGGDGYLMVVGLNPSTADERVNDPTVRRCINFAKLWGFGALCMTNAFAFRTVSPTIMMAQDDPVGPDNDIWLQTAAEHARLVVAAWGVHGVHLQRGARVAQMLPGLHHLGLTKDGHPKHPLYLPGDVKPQLWPVQREGAAP